MGRRDVQNLYILCQEQQNCHGGLGVRRYPQYTKEPSYPYIWCPGMDRGNEVPAQQTEVHSSPAPHQSTNGESVPHNLQRSATRSVNKVMRLIQYNSVLTFKLQIEFVPFKIVPLGGYTPPETLFPLFVATLVVANRNRF